MTNSLTVLDKEKLINIHNVSINYTDNGSMDSSVIFLIQGFPFNKSIWNNQVILLQENYRVITYDVNVQNTEMNVISIGLFVKDLIGLMDALSIKKATLCGLSMGGYFTLNAIENFPKRFEGLILCDDDYISETLLKIENCNKSELDRLEQGSDQYEEECIESIYDLESFIKRKEEIIEIRQMIRNSTSESLNQSFNEDSVLESIRKNIITIKVPVFFIVGKVEKTKQLNNSEMMPKNSKNSFLKIIEHSRNISNMESSNDENRHFSKIVSLLHNKAM